MKLRRVQNQHRVICATLVIVLNVYPLLAFARTPEAVSVGTLSVEYKQNPIGIDVLKPRCSQTTF
jgi:hypothetical protein